MISVATADEMHQLGEKLSANLRAGDLILVNGPLGAGKTVLAQGVGAGLGITESHHLPLLFHEFTRQLCHLFMWMHIA
jgi:tRNA A37 threonylcarbamoyladenosine biosynthesis protein TsaE